MSAFLQRIIGYSPKWPGSLHRQSLSNEKSDKQKPRGIKRKAGSDFYDPLGREVVGIDQKIPLFDREQQRRVSQASEFTTTNVDKSKHARRSSLANQDSSFIKEFNTLVPANFKKINSANATRLQCGDKGDLSSPLVPVAVMAHSGDATELLVEPPRDGSIDLGTRIQTKTRRPMLVVGVEADDDVYEVEALLQHRVSKDGSIDIQVHWVGELEANATWEPEHEIQVGAEETLYSYWKALGGRNEALFRTPKDPAPEKYHVFKILRHEKSQRGGFQFQVQWVGYPTTSTDTTMESESKLRRVAPGLLEGYWESVGGRDKFLAKRLKKAGGI